jgi:hypothetical protein
MAAGSVAAAVVALVLADWEEVGSTAACRRATTYPPAAAAVIAAAASSVTLTSFQDIGPYPTVVQQGMCRAEHSHSTLPARCRTGRGQLSSPNRDICLQEPLQKTAIAASRLHRMPP